MHYYRFNISDWALHTAHLSPEEEGIYFRLVNFYYDTEQPIPKETHSVFRRLRLGSHSEAAAQILEEFFCLEGDFWHHKRCDSEITNYREQAERNRVNGKRGGRPKGSGHKQKHSDKPKKTLSVNSGNPDKTLTTNHKPLTNNQREGRKRPIPPDFVIDDSMRRWVEEKYPALAWQQATDQWKNAMLARGQKYVDWRAAWRNGMGKADEWRREKQTTATSSRSRSLEQDLSDTSWAH